MVLYFFACLFNIFIRSFASIFITKKWAAPSDKLDEKRHPFIERTLTLAEKISQDQNQMKSIISPNTKMRKRFFRCWKTLLNLDIFDELSKCKKAVVSVIFWKMHRIHLHGHKIRTPVRWSMSTKFEPYQRIYIVPFPSVPSNEYLQGTLEAWGFVNFSILMEYKHSIALCCSFISYWNCNNFLLRIIYWRMWKFNVHSEVKPKSPGNRKDE